MIQESVHLTPEEADQAAENAVPSAVAAGGAFGLFGAGVGAFVDAHRNKKFVEGLKTAEQEKAEKLEKDRARITYSDASTDILSG